MNTSNSNEAGSPKRSARSARLGWFVIIIALLITLVAIFLPRAKVAPADANSSKSASQDAEAGNVTGASGTHRRLNSAGKSKPAETAEEIVANKIRQFAQNRRVIAERIAARSNQNLPPEISAFFDAVEKGNWEEIHSRWKELATHTHQYDYSKNDRPDLEPYWQTVLDTYLPIEVAYAYDIPAQKYLDYGNAILDSLRPDMVYVGGTDDGRGIPTLLNETSDNPHIVLTQNALADGTYLDYLHELYGDRFHTLSQDDSQRAFQEYTADAQKRFEHDQNFPDEPKQVRPGENIKMLDGKVQVTGQAAVMGINEKLLQMLMQKNPDLSFAMQESFPLRGTYADALPLGPIMELGVKDAQTAFTAERAAQSVDYWRATAQLVLADPQAAGSENTLKTYSHDVNSTANLLASHNFTSEAEQAYRLASQIFPSNPEAVTGLANVLAQTGRTTEARQLLDEFGRKYPAEFKKIDKAGVTFLWSSSAAKPSP
jgi:tetratricopeptide (TPR) repeat protein